MSSQLWSHLQTRSARREAGLTVGANQPGYGDCLWEQGDHREVTLRRKLMHLDGYGSLVLLMARVCLSACEPDQTELFWSTPVSAHSPPR